MDLAGICAVATAMESLSWAYASIARRSLDTSIQVARAHTGWDSADTVQSCQEVWSKQLSDLLGVVGTMAQKLHDSTEMVQQTDQEVAHRLDSVFTGLPYQV